MTEVGIASSEGEIAPELPAALLTMLMDASRRAHATRSQWRADTCVRTEVHEDGAPSRLEWLSAAQHDRCFYCDCETWLSWQKRKEARLRVEWDIPGSRSMACQLAFDYRMATVEHLRGRTDPDAERPGNLVMACAFCNSSRHDRTPATHRTAMRELKQLGRHPCFPA